MATATATMDASQSLIQTESYHYSEVSETRQTKKKKSRRHKEEGTISVSKSSEKLHKKLKAGASDSNPQCSACSRPVFAMERVQAERRAWHKECFRCAQCNKQLTVETYQSDHTTLYCKPHFKQLFEPKPVDGDDQTDAAPKKHQMIICESNPVELPPDVVRASDKPDLGLEELSQLDVKSRFEVFERKNKDEPLPAEPRAPREKSTALLSKLAKFKAKGMDVGVSDEYLNGVPVEASSSEPEDEEDDEDSVLKKSYRHTNGREHAVALHNMSELLGRWESGAPTASDRRRDTKQEIQEIRSRLFMGKQAKIKEMYEQSVLQSEQGITSAEKIAQELELDAEKARAIKERFESGQVFNDENQPPKNREIDDSSLFREGIGKKSRSIFLELDANAKHVTPAQPQEPPKRKEIPFIPKDVVRAADKVEDVHIETADISDRFKFFETYKPAEQRKEFRMTPPRTTQRPKSPSPELYVDEAVARAGAGAPPPDTHTASRMISVFRQMEENCTRPDDRGPKPLKRFTPPPPGESNHHGDSSSEYSDEEDSEDERERALTARQPDEALQQAQQLARTTSFRDRFEKWTEPARPEHARPEHAQPSAPASRADVDDDGESQLETAKSLREKFENLKVQQSSVTKTFVPKVNRFV